MSTTNDIIKVYVSEPFVEVYTPANPPEITNLEGIPVAQGVYFQWDIDANITPFYVEYRVKIGTDPYTNWKVVYDSNVYVVLSAADIAAFGTVPSMIFEARVTNGTYVGTTESVSTAPRDGLFVSDDMNGLEASAVSASLLGRMFTDTDRSANDITESVTRYFGTETGADKTSNNTADDVANVDGTPASDISVWASNGNDANDKILADVGGGTIETTSGAQSKVDTRLSSVEKANLTANKTVSGSDIFHEGNKPDKADVGLGNVENKSSATILGEITNTILTDNTDVVLDSEILAKINASTETTKIDGTQITSILADRVKNSAAESVFDNDGNFIGDIKDGATVMTAAQLIAANSDGKSKELDLSSISDGTVDDLAARTGSTHAITTVAQVEGADKAAAALDTNNKLQTGTPNKTVAQIEGGLADYDVVWNEAKVGAGVTDFDEIDLVATINADDLFLITTHIFDENKNTLRLRIAANPDDTSSKIFMKIFDEAGQNVIPSMEGEVTMTISTGYNFYQVDINISTLSAGLYQVRAGIEGALNSHYFLKGGICYAINT